MQLISVQSGALPFKNFSQSQKKIYPPLLPNAPIPKKIRSSTSWYMLYQTHIVRLQGVKWMIGPSWLDNWWLSLLAILVRYAAVPPKPLLQHPPSSVSLAGERKINSRDIPFNWGLGLTNLAQAQGCEHESTAVHVTHRREIPALHTKEKPN